MQPFERRLRFEERWPVLIGAGVYGAAVFAMGYAAGAMLGHALAAFGLTLSMAVAVPLGLATQFLGAGTYVYRVRAQPSGWFALSYGLWLNLIVVGASNLPLLLQGMGLDFATIAGLGSQLLLGAGISALIFRGAGWRVLRMSGIRRPDQGEALSRTFE